MLTKPDSIGWLDVVGTPFEIGYAAGKQGRAAVYEHLLPSPIWALIKDKKHASTVARLINNTQKQYPRIWQECQGLADGLELPIQDVFAWNCRGDILSSTPDGCSTIVEPGTPIRIAHNEDGLPFFRGQCFILNASPDNETAFRAFCYPGSIAGHTFGWNDAGLAQAVNNLRLNGVTPEIPRMVLARAVIASPSLNNAIKELSDKPCSGGFHMTLADSKSMQLQSVEYGAGKVSVKQIQSRSCHTNHTLHLMHPDQTVTKSSYDRQYKLEHLIAKNNCTINALTILRNTSGPGLPIRRNDPADPDQENTLATCVMEISSNGISWQLYDE